MLVLCVAAPWKLKLASWLLANVAWAAVVRSPSPLTLIAVNLVPIVGVLFLGWSLGNLMLLYWAETAVIGLYTILKVPFLVRWWWLLVYVPVFAIFFGVCMGVHLLLIGGITFAMSGLRDPAQLTFADLFRPVLPSLALLVVSHGVSFVQHFVRGGARAQLGARYVHGGEFLAGVFDRVGLTVSTLYVGLIVAGLLEDLRMLLVVLVLVKTVVDLHAHLRHHRADYAGRSQRTV